MDGEPPAHLTDWKRNDWTPASDDARRAPELAVLRARRRSARSIAPEWEDPKGVPISAFLFGGRRATTVPLVFESRDWNHGVFVGRDDGLGEDRRRVRRARRAAPRPVRDAAVLRLPHGRLLRALAVDDRAHRRGEAAHASTASTGSARTTTASSSGPASARTRGCSSGSVGRLEGDAGGDRDADRRRARGRRPRPRRPRRIARAGRGRPRRSTRTSGRPRPPTPASTSRRSATTSRRPSPTSSPPSSPASADDSRTRSLSVDPGRPWSTDIVRRGQFVRGQASARRSSEWRRVASVGPERATMSSSASATFAKSTR